MEDASAKNPSGFPQKGGSWIGLYAWFGFVGLRSVFKRGALKG